MRYMIDFFLYIFIYLAGELEQGLGLVGGEGGAGGGLEDYDQIINNVESFMEMCQEQNRYSTQFKLYSRVGNTIQ